MKNRKSSGKQIDRSVPVLIAANLFPLAGVLLLNWDAMELVVFYCFETFIIGIFNTVKMVKAEGKVAEENCRGLTYGLLQLGSCGDDTFMMKLVLVPFFVVHYNGFVIVQTFMIIYISNHLLHRDYGLMHFLSIDFIVNIALMVFSHYYSYKTHFIEREEYKRVVPAYLLFSPYKRIFIQQLTVITGGFFLALLKGPVGFLIVLIFLKVAFDIRAHRASHRHSG